MFSGLLALFLLVGAHAEEASRPVNLWPFFYRQRTADGLEVEALASLVAYKRAGRKIDLAVRPFYWRSTDSERRYSRSDFLWPLGLREVNGDESKAHVFPLFWQKRKPPDFYSLIFPLYHYRSDAASRRLGIIGFQPFTAFDFYRDDARDIRSERWVIWTHERSRERSSLNLMPLLSYESDPAGGRRRCSALGLPAVFNLFERNVDATKSLDEGHALLYWRRTSPEDNFLHVWPLYGWRQRDTSVERSFLWPFFRREADPPRRESDLNAPWPLARFHHQGERVLDYAVPLFFHRETQNASQRVIVPWYRFADTEEGTRHFGFFPLYHGSRWPGSALDIALPLFGSYRTPGFSATALPPVYWRFTSSGSAVTALLPVYFDRTSPDWNLRVLFPFYYHTRDAGHTEFTYYFPLYGTVTQDGRVTRHLLLFPLYSRVNDPALGLRSVDLLWPFFHVESSSGASSARLLPLYWRSQAPESRFEMFFPLYWDMENDWSRQRYLLPLYGSFERKGDLRVDVFGPLYWRIDKPQENYRRDDFLLSLYSRTRAGNEYRSHLFPFYWRSSSPGQESRHFPPLGGYQRSDIGDRDIYFLGVAPKISLFEFASSPKDGERTDRALIYYRSESRDSTLAALVPLYFQWKNPDDRGRVLFPLYARHEDVREGSWNTAFLGLYGGFSLVEFTGEPKGDRDSQRVLLYYHQRDGADRMTLAVPLYWRFESAGKDWNQLFPFFAESRDDAASERGLGVLGVTPRWSLFSNQATKADTSSRLWPLYGVSRKKDGSGGSFFLIGVHPKFSVFSKEEEGAATDVRVLFRLVRWKSGPDESAFEFNPFFYRVRTGERRYWAIFGGLFGVEHQPDGKRRFTYFWM